jgi:hypothetical protein
MIAHGSNQKACACVSGQAFNRPNGAGMRASDARHFNACLPIRKQAADFRRWMARKGLWKTASGALSFSL